MKKQYAFLFLFLVSMMITVSAQSTTDTVKIPGAQSLNISNIINADTSVTAFRVYVLDRGAIYYIDRAFELTHSCKFISVGNAPRPAVLAPAIRADDTSEEWYFKLVKTNISVELNDLYLLSLRSDGKALGWSRAIHIGASNTGLKLRRVVFDGWTEAGIRVDGADFVKLDVQDCHFRNFVHGSSYFGGQPFLSGHNDHPDTTVFINNTFFNCNSYLFSIRGLGPKSVFEHNSVVYTAVNPLLTRQADNLFVENNLFYAAHAWGGDPEQRIGAWFLNYPDTVSSAIILFREKIPYLYFDAASYSGPEAHYSDLGLTYDPTKKVTSIHNNVNFNPQKLKDFYTNWNATVTSYDSVEVITGPKQYLKRELVMAPWLNGLGKMVRDSMTNPFSSWYSPTVDLQDAMEVDPQFSDAGVVGQLDNLISYVNKIASRQLDDPWPYEFNFPPKWPLPENLAYTNAALTHGGTDGYAIGDLNWFPDQKAQWAAGQEQFAVTVDGNKDAFYSTLTGPGDGYLQFRAYAGNDNGFPDNDADLSAKVWGAWDATWLHLYAEVKDDVISGNGPNVWEEDCIELKIDPQPTDSTNSGSSVWAAGMTALAAGAPGVVRADDLGGIAAENKQFKRILTGDGYILEMSIKWSAIAANNETIAPAAGNVFGMAINFHDNDGNARRDGSVQWAAVMRDAVWNTPKYHGTVKFLEGNKLQFIPTNNMTGATNPVPYDGSDWTSVNQVSQIPQEFSLSQNYPNPFNPSTQITFSLKETAPVSLMIYNTIGELVTTLVNNEIKSAGKYIVNFDANNLSTGVYVYVLRQGQQMLSRKMLLMK